MIAAGTPALDELADRCGIESEYRDARGEMKAAGADTRRALLAAMGVVADDETAARAALAELERADWQQAVAPVYVLYRTGRPLEVCITLPAGSAEVPWIVRLEEGRELRGNEHFDTLALLERRDIGAAVRERRLLALPADLPCGYHELILGSGLGRSALIVTPGKCWLPAEIERGERLWGVSAQLYLLRSAGDWGIGDYGDLTHLVTLLLPRGASVIGLNPLHAMFLDDPEHASPYSPASRLLLNVLNIDVAQVEAMRKSRRGAGGDDSAVRAEVFEGRLQHCRDAPLVDYSGVAALKLPVLRSLFAEWEAARDCAEWRAFAAFRRASGELFERGVLFLAIREHFSGKPHCSADWHTWPEDFRDPRSAAVARFAAEHADHVTFHAWLQYLADLQLEAAAAAAAPMAVGLYRDLAVGADRTGAETWANQSAVVADAQVGAPPDIYNPSGQDWGLPPFNPRALRAEAYRSFIDLIRTNMRHAGGLRIDHVMALRQLYWVPRGRSPAEGAYVRYPLEDLVGIIALESQRNRCLVVGEDLGTVPEGFRERMASARILSYRVLFFEKDKTGFIAPPDYPKLAIAVEGSHDLPTLSAWWQAADLRLKEQLDLFPHPDDARRARAERDQDRRDLLAALRAAGLADAAFEPNVDPDLLFRAAHTFLARTDSALALVQLDDITDELSPVNVPTTSNEHPNWRRRLSLSLEQLNDCARFTGIAEIFRRERPLDAGAGASRACATP